MDGGPSVIGRYELHQPLASGGMATVYLGRMRSESGLARTVALKRMHRHLATDPEFVAMFFDEARLSMRLQHPNIVPTFDVVSTHSELLLVMEYIQGESLAGLLAAARDAGERIPPAITSSIMCGILAGLHAAHEARTEDGAPLEIVHRDVSPQNVMVGIDGAARLLDFGIAKAAGRAHSTALGQVKGKFAYMAPEQLTLDDVDRRADVFAAAVVLWETLTGERLFRGDSPASLVHAVLSSEIAPPSAVVPGLPRALDAVVMRGLARQKRERYATAREMAAALETAVPPANARAVGEWVEALVASTLSARSSLVRDVESAERPASRESEMPTRVLEVSGRSEMPSAAFTGEGAATANATSPLVPRRRAARWARSMGFAVVGLGVTTVGVAMTRTAAKVNALEPATAPAPPAMGASAAPPPSEASAPAQQPPPHPATPAAPASTRLRPRAHPTPPRPDCSNPFVVDSRGLRVPRPECF